MTTFLNPFYIRYSETYVHPQEFIDAFGADAANMLPDDLWGPLVVIRSSPGGGKTSLMQLFTVHKLEWVASHVSADNPVHTALSKCGAIEDGRPHVNAILVDLKEDYRSILSLRLDKTTETGLFLRLLDARIMRSIIANSLELRGLKYPDDAAALRFVVRDNQMRYEEFLAKLGGPGGVGCLEFAEQAEREVLSFFDALRDSQRPANPVGHGSLYSLRVLDKTQVTVDGEPLPHRIVLMFDDGHALGIRQREILLQALLQRSVNVSRWYAERFDALSDQEVMEIGSLANRDLTIVDLNRIARGDDSQSSFTRSRHNKLLAKAAHLRAKPLLAPYAYKLEPEAERRHAFFTLIEPVDQSGSVAKIERGIATIRERLLTPVESNKSLRSFQHWFDEADSLKGRCSLIRWKEVEILIARDLKRVRLSETPAGPLTTRSNSELRKGAEWLAAREFKLPFYAGEERIIALGSNNIDQFMLLCGGLFDELIVHLSVGKAPKLSAERQHSLLVKASESYWGYIANTFRYGREIQLLVKTIVELAHYDNEKPTFPYPPGVTGISLLESERNQLMDKDFRQDTDGAEQLFAVLASALAHNVLMTMYREPDEGEPYRGLYLNRLLCPKFGLPLGYGGQRRRTVRDLLHSMATKSQRSNRNPLQLELDEIP